MQIPLPPPRRCRAQPHSYPNIAFPCFLTRPAMNFCFNSFFPFYCCSPTSIPVRHHPACKTCVDLYERTRAFSCSAGTQTDLQVTEKSHRSTGTQTTCLPSEKHISSVTRTGTQQTNPDETCLPEEETHRSTEIQEADADETCLPEEIHTSVRTQQADNEACRDGKETQHHAATDGTFLNPGEEAHHSMGLQQEDLDGSCLLQVVEEEVHSSSMRTPEEAHEKLSIGEMPFSLVGFSNHTAILSETNSFPSCSPPSSPILVTAAMVRDNQKGGGGEDPHLRRDSLARLLGSQPPFLSCAKTLSQSLSFSCATSLDQSQSISSAATSLIQSQSQGWVADSSALQASNLLQLAASGGFIGKWHRTLQRGLQHHKRDCMDMAGKVSFSASV